MGYVTCVIGMFTSNPNIYNNIIINNSADYGGALHIFDNRKPNIINNTISGNFATQEGGGVMLKTLTSCFSDEFHFMEQYFIRRWL